MKDGRLAQFFSSLAKGSICVVGDFMVDAYTEGAIERVSPEAPVCVLHVNKESFRPGGAGNVVLNLLSLGANVLAIGRIGDDKWGNDLLFYLKEQGSDLQGIFFEKGYTTIVKNRLIADKQQVIRVDHENISPLSKEIEDKVYKLLEKKIKDIQVLAISDYGKGFLSTSLLEKMIKLAKANNTIVIVDPKGKDFTKYAHADIIKPNEKEAYIAANLPHSDSIDDVAAKLLKEIHMKNLVVTRSSKGISLFDQDNIREDFPVHSKEVVDVTGAGDTVLAALSIALANKLSLQEAIYLSNICAGIAIERVGCPQITLYEVAKRLLKKDVANKIFQEDHLFALKHLLKDIKTVLLGLDGQEEFSLQLFKALKKLSSRDRQLIIYVKDLKPNEDLINILSSLKEVGFIIIKKMNFDHFIHEIEPDSIYQYKMGQLEKLEPSEVF